MSESIIFIGIDVDDKYYHGSAYEKGVGIVREFKCRPTSSHLVKQLKTIGKDKEIRVCYEATYIGFTLQRSLKKQGYHCDVIAPSLIPDRRGKRQKTDRIDSRKLAEYYSNDQLVSVHIPTESQEQVRGLLRSRYFVRDQIKKLKLHILSQCRLSGIDYKKEQGGQVNNWTQQHRVWLRVKMKRLEEMSLMNFEILLGQLEQQEQVIEMYDKKILEISESPVYRKKIKSLNCFRGLDTLTSMTLVSELGDIRRFSHPRQLTSYAGLDIVEYSSGGKTRQYGISKQGNRHVRRVIVEACQQAKKLPRISKRLKASRQDVDMKSIKIADRCMDRLYKKSSRLLYRGKCANKVKVACGREFLNFVWESLQAVA